MRISASAPSNIALIKYMGKKTQNIPANSSLSYTLEKFRSYVVLEEWEKQDQVFELDHLEDFNQNQYPLEEVKFKESEAIKFLNFFKFLKTKFDIKGHYKIFSGNDFPLSCGLASSASSFAALTQATYKLGKELRPGLGLSEGDLSSLSRQGSGSSCRSFFSPWSIWTDKGAKEINFPQLDLKHLVIAIDSDAKKVSSSEAHKIIETSLLNHDRPNRADLRLKQLIESFENENWTKAFDICWAEFWDMHALFHTSSPPFQYMTDKSIKALSVVHNFWLQHQNGPLVTMDAGPNIHLLWRAYDDAFITQLKNILKVEFKILERS